MIYSFTGKYHDDYIWSDLRQYRRYTVYDQPCIKNDGFEDIFPDKPQFPYMRHDIILAHQDETFHRLKRTSNSFRVFLIRNLQYFGILKIMNRNTTVRLEM